MSRIKVDIIVFCEFRADPFQLQITMMQGKEWHFGYYPFVFSSLR